MDRGTEPSFDPTPPPPGGVPDRRWWGRPLAEVRWQAELARLLVDPVYRGEGVPRGTGEPVVCIPGFLAGDGSLAVMREWLTRMGYAAHPAGINANVDCSDRALDRLERRVEAIVRRAGRKVSLVGHSRGGQFGKALATRRPDLVSRLVSLGSPLAAPLDVSIPTRAFVAGLRSYLHASSPLLARNGCMTTTCLCPFADSFRAEWPASVPCTSVYTRSDGVVWWEACLVPYARSVEVGCSHVGMAVSAPVYHHIAAALAEPVDRWTAEGLTT